MPPHFRRGVGCGYAQPMSKLPCVFDHDDWRPFVAAWLRAARAAGWRVGWRQLAESIGCSVEHLRAMRRGRRRLGAESALAMANALGLGMAETWQIGRLAALDHAGPAERPALLASITAARAQHRQRLPPPIEADPWLAAIAAVRRSLLDRSPQQREVRGEYCLTSTAALPRLQLALGRLTATVQSYDHPDGAPVTFLAYILPMSRTLREMHHGP